MLFECEEGFGVRLEVESSFPVVSTCVVCVRGRGLRIELEVEICCSAVGVGVECRCMRKVRVREGVCVCCEVTVLCAALFSVMLRCVRSLSV